jgi:hypothetical protein
MEAWLTMTVEERVDEVGTEPGCPFCQRARVTRSSYIRCNHCGVNWSEGDNIFKDPRIRDIKSFALAAVGGAQTARSIFQENQSGSGEEGE